MWCEQGKDVIYIQHISNKSTSLFYLSNEGFPIKQMVAPLATEKIFTKTVNSSFIGTDLEKYLRMNDTMSVVIVGFTTPHCVSTTRMSANLGFETYLIEDATVAFSMKDHYGVHYDAEIIHATTLATLHEEFATIMTTEEFIGKYGHQKEQPI